LIKSNAVYFSLLEDTDAAKIINSAICDDSNRKEMITKARLYAEKTVKREAYIKNLLKIYEQVLEKR